MITFKDPKPCLINPCGSTGVCKNVPGKNEYTCDCTEDRGGKNCEIRKFLKKIARK